MQAKQLTQDQYAMNHPAGRIGKRLMLRVADLMISGSALPLASAGDGIMDVSGVLQTCFPLIPHCRTERPHTCMAAAFVIKIAHGGVQRWQG